MKISLTQALPLALHLLSLFGEIEADKAILDSIGPDKPVALPASNFSFGGVSFGLKAVIKEVGSGGPSIHKSLFGLWEANLLIAFSIAADIETVVQANPGISVPFPPLRFDAGNTHYEIDYAVGRPDTGTPSTFDTSLQDFHPVSK